MFSVHLTTDEGKTSEGFTVVVFRHETGRELQHRRVSKKGLSLWFHLFHDYLAEARYCSG